MKLQQPLVRHKEKTPPGRSDTYPEKTEKWGALPEALDMAVCGCNAIVPTLRESVGASLSSVMQYVQWLVCILTSLGPVNPWPARESYLSQHSRVLSILPSACSLYLSELECPPGATYVPSCPMLSLLRPVLKSVPILPQTLPPPSAGHRGPA